MNFYLPLVLFCIASLVTPGPNNFMIMMSGINFGILRSIPHYLGICLGFTLMVLLVGLGLGKIFTIIPSLHMVIKVGGSIYMLFLAYKIISASTDVTDIDTKRKPLTFFQAALFQWVNPKAWVMAIGAISAYTSINGNMLGQVLIICVLFLVLGLPCIAIWLFGGVALRKYMKNPRHMRVINLILGGLLAFSIVLVLF